MSRKAVDLALPTIGDQVVEALMRVYGTGEGVGIALIISLPDGSVTSTTNMTEKDFNDFVSFVANAHKEGEYTFDDHGKETVQ